MIKKAIILLGGLGTRFLPITKAIPKEMIPVIEKPVFHYLIDEARNSGAKEIILVTSPGKQLMIKKYLSAAPKLEKILKERKKHHLIADLQTLPPDVSLKICQQKSPLGDGHAILQAKDLIGEEPFGVFFGDDIIDSDVPALSQLAEVYKKYKASVVALERIPKDRIHLYGVVKTEKIANRLYKIRGIIEKPQASEAPSDLAIPGRYVLTPDIFEILEDMKPGPRGEIILADALALMIKMGKPVYGLECKGRWLACGDKLGFLKTTVLLSLKHPKFGKDFKEFLKNLKI